MNDHKRKVSVESHRGIAGKSESRYRHESALALASTSGNNKAVALAGPKRTSGLQAPIMHLSGHAGDVTSCRFSPTGEHIASGSADARVFLWNTYGRLHKLRCVLEVQWMPNGRLITASADKTVAVWDTLTGERLKRSKGHSGAVNACCPLNFVAGDDNLYASASDDGTVMLWDARQRHATAEIDHDLPLTSIAVNGNTVYAGSLDNNVTGWDIRTLGQSLVLRGHSDTVMGLTTSPKTGHYLLSTSLDNTVRLWDLRPFSSNVNRCERVFTGAPHGYERNLIRPAFDKDETLVASGSADRTLTIWNMRSGEIKYKLPGHKGSVNQADFHPLEPIVLSGSVDKTMFLGEI
ncbi:U5 snRNP-specific protein [Linderina pennispora]|uniref:U5 snRNP-specific protein n=1 Tax=Linderina pennispora TaxID=61395 RepID=A0A1Y1WK87_9FUNG|nr:U5 snRNP-specific protein [Linderina pennispora]ORX73892.1 U5 snRNP-specific protein [Linderina pennispora]